MRVVALAGGVGGAKLANGLSQCLNSGELSIIVNTGDDFEHFGLYICPDIDTVCYTLAGISNPLTGWGRATETWNTVESIKILGGPTWFQIGDRDLGTHLERTRRLQAGQSLTTITEDFRSAWGIKNPIFPMSDNPVRTIVDTQEYGQLGFQEYFAKYHCSPTVKQFIFHGIEKSSPSPMIQKALDEADLVVFCPSNPWVSIDPILSVPGILGMVRSKPTVAVSPIIQGETVKGPAAKMYREFGITPSAGAVGRHYKDLLSGFIYDELDSGEEMNLPEHIRTYRTDILMRNTDDQRRLANKLLQFSSRLGGK